MYQDRREQRGNQKKCKAGRADQHKSKKGGQHGVDYGQGQTANPTDETNALVTGSPSALLVGSGFRGHLAGIQQNYQCII